MTVLNSILNKILANKKILVTLLGLIIIFYLYRNLYNKQTDTFIIAANNHNNLLKSIRHQDSIINEFIFENKSYQLIIDNLIKNRDEIKINESKITQSYEKLQQTISNSNDSVQCGITKDLLSRHRAFKFKRD